MAVRIDDIETNRGLQAATIAAQNDLFRKGLIDGEAQLQAHRQGITGKIMLTQGVCGRSAEFQECAMKSVAEFNDFNEDNDPYGDHTFAAVTVGNRKLFWKIDLYDEHYEYGSERPYDPTVTRRVLTIMEPQEY